MTFMVSHDGVIYQKDLGPETEEAVANMNDFNPGDGWKKMDHAS
jgi:Protein of unknown function (DUF2950)